LAFLIEITRRASPRGVHTSTTRRPRSGPTLMKRGSA